MPSIISIFTISPFVKEIRSSSLSCTNSNNSETDYYKLASKYTYVHSVVLTAQSVIRTGDYGSVS